MIPRPTKHDAPLDPAIAAELETLEAALSGAPNADPDLAALVRQVRADAPSMPLALRERLDADVAAGFPRARRRPRLPKLTLGRVLPALGGAAAVLVAVVVATGSLSGGTGSPTGSPAGSSAGSAPAASVHPDSATPSMGTIAPEAAAGSSASAAPVSPATAKETTSAPRKVERAVDLSLTVGAGQLQDAADGVVQATQSVGGYVSDSQVSARGGLGDGTFTLRVPTARLDEAVAKLSKLGHVASLDQSAQDIAGPFVSVGDQLSDARRERAALLRALGQAQTEGQIAALKQRIAENRSELATLKGRLDGLRRRADLSTVSVALSARRGAAAVPGAGGDSGWGVGDAARDALHVLQVAAGVVIVVAAVLVPVALLGYLGLLVTRSTRRRQREHALDGA